MANDLLVPVLGLGRGEGTLVGWYREDGEEVSAGDLVFCFESGNVAVDVEAPEDGYVWHEASAGSQPRWGETVGVVLAPGETFVPRGATSFVPPDEVTAAADPDPHPGAEPRYSFEEYEVRPEAPPEPSPVTPAALPLLRRRRDEDADEPANGFWGPSAPGDQTEFDSPLLWRSASEAWPWGRDDDGQARRRRLLPVRPASAEDDAPAANGAYAAAPGDDAGDWDDAPETTPDGEWEPVTPASSAWSAAGEEDAGDEPLTPYHPPAPAAEARWDDAPPPPLTWDFEPSPAAATWSANEPAAEPERLFDDGQWEVVAEPAEWDTPAPAAWPPAPTTPFAWDAPAPGSLAERMPSWEVPEAHGPGAPQPLAPVASDVTGDTAGDWQPLSDEVEPWPGEPSLAEADSAEAGHDAAFVPEAPSVPAFEARGDVVEPWDDPAGNADPVAAVTRAAPARAAALWLRTEVPAAGLVEVQHHLGTEWGGPGPGVAVLVASAMGRALAEFGSPGADVLLDTPARPEGHRAILRAAGERPMRELVDDALSHCPHDALFDCALTDFGAAGIDEGIAPIAEGQPFGLAAGAIRDILSFVAGRPALSPVVTLALSYDPLLVSPGDAAWFLGRVRALCEAPHALLTA